MYTSARDSLQNKQNVAVALVEKLENVASMLTRAI